MASVPLFALFGKLSSKRLSDFFAPQNHAFITSFSTAFINFL